jgi:hypothetical protein
VQGVDIERKIDIEYKRGYLAMRSMNSMEIEDELRMSADRRNGCR